VKEGEGEEGEGEEATNRGGDVVSSRWANEKSAKSFQSMGKVYNDAQRERLNAMEEGGC
jgi:hypothetical protein